MKLQLILLSFIALSSFQLVDVDGLRKQHANVSGRRTISSPANHHRALVQYFQLTI